MEKQIRESFSLKTDDIQGAKPKSLYSPYINKPVYSNTTAGIDKSSPQSSHLKTNRIVNPLTPEYKLPSSPLQEPFMRKFLRNSLDVSDIQGTSSYRLLRNVIRNPLDVSDIMNKKKENKKIFVESKEIQNLRFKTKRITNPLNPEYLIRDSDNKLISYGEIPGSTPKTIINVNQKPHTRNLDVTDIQGTPANGNSNTWNSFIKPSLSLKEYKESALSAEFIKKIEGTASKSRNNSPEILQKKEKGISSQKNIRKVFDFEKNDRKKIKTDIKKPPRSPVLSPKAKK